jgi:hypothetical protein
MPTNTIEIDAATTDILDLQRMPTTGPIDIEVDYSAAVSYCVCGVGQWTHTRPEI